MSNKIEGKRKNNMRHFKDAFGNSATIEEREMLPSKRSNSLEKAYILSLYADYDDHFLYYRAVYETEEIAMERLKLHSCGSFKQNIVRNQ